MYRVEVWSAGHRLRKAEGGSLEEADSLIKDFKESFFNGLIRFNTNATQAVVESICVDVIEVREEGHTKLIKVKNFKI